MYGETPAVDFEAEVHRWIDRAMDAEERVEFAEAKAIGYGCAAELEKERADAIERRYHAYRLVAMLSGLLNAGLILWLVWLG